MSGSVVWYLDRATGVVALVLMTLTVVLGVVVRRDGRLPGLPRSGAVRVHRNVGLLSALLLVVHVTTAVLDPFVDIGAAAALVPFASGWSPLTVGLGTLAVDLLVLVVATSLLRDRVRPRLWRAVHLTSYAMWPLAFGHALATGTDVGSGWLLALVLGCAAAVLVASAAALAGTRTARPATDRAPAALARTAADLAAGRALTVHRNR
jgi:sulfoxide reductase heme-binding subunit YedZ